MFTVHAPVVVVGTDGSATATEAVRRAADIVRAQGGRLHVVTAFDGRNDSAASEVPSEFTAVAQSSGMRAERILQRVANGPASGIDIEIHPEHGGVVEVLTRVASTVGADLIVVGNQRPAMMPGFIAGSIADRIVHRAHCDVLVVDTDGAAA
jgi:nucleotide-binding universal stress UspA family protein